MYGYPTTGDWEGTEAGELTSVGKVYLRWVRRFNRYGTRRSARGVIHGNQGLNAVLGRIGADLRAGEPSSANGTKARRYALAEIAGWQTTNRYEIRAMRSWLAGHRARMRVWLRRSDRTWKRTTLPAGRRAVRAFAAAGFHSRNRALSQVP